MVISFHIELQRNKNIQPNKIMSCSYEFCVDNETVMIDSESLVDLEHFSSMPLLENAISTEISYMKNLTKRERERESHFPIRIHSKLVL